MNPRPASRSLPAILLLTLLALVPVTFERWTQECFEVPESALLITLALALLGYGIAGELGRAAREGGGYPGAAARRLGAWVARDPLGASILVFLGSALASTIVAPNPAQSLHGAPDSSAGWIVACATATVYFAARSVSRGDPVTLERMARAAGFASAIASGYALMQLTGLDPLVWGRTASYEGDVRIFGTLGHPNILGAYLAMTAPLTVWLAWRARSGAERALWATVATASAVTIAATLSRGAWIGLAAGGIAVPCLTLLGRGSVARPGAPSNAKAALLVSLALALLALLFFARTPMGPHLVERLRQIASLSAPTTQSRLHIWRAAWRMFQDHPVWGVGLDAFGTFYPRYRTAEYWKVEWGRTPNKAHNEGLGILATQGLVGALAALLVLTLAAVAIVRAVRRSEGAARSGAIVAGAALVAFVAQDLASFTVVALGSLAAALAGWLGSVAETRVPGPRSKGGRPPWALALAAAAMVALFFPLVLRPLLAQRAEKVALRADLGTPERADALEWAAREAPWDARYPSLLGASLLEEAGREPSAARGRTLLRRAAEAERKAISIEPENGYFHAALGRVAAAQAELRPPEANEAEAYAAFTEALRRDPTNAEIMDQTSNAMIRLGRKDEARLASLTAARLYPEVGQPLAFLGYLALLDHRWADAADTLSRAVRGQWYGEVLPREAAWSNLSAAYLALNRNEEARRAAEEALALQPLDKDAQGNRDLAAQRLGARP